MQNNFKSGFITITGRPNVGKSTLLNTLTGAKIAAVSHKKQTTRCIIQGVITTEGYQAVFIDTPGIHTPRRKLGVYMEKSINSAVAGVDIVFFMVEPTLTHIKKDAEIIKKLSGISTDNRPLFLIINKIDTVNTRDILPVIDAYKAITNFTEIIPVSAQKHINIEEITSVIIKYLPPGPMYFPEDYITDQPERRIAAEIIREKALVCLDEEIPHGIAVEIENMTRREGTPAIIDTDACIYCEKKTHKGIIIGKNGAKLKQIGTMARLDIQALLGEKVNLKLWVKVKENWRDSDFLLRSFGYDIKKI